MIQSFIKPVNLYLAGSSYLISSLTGKARIRGMPVSVGIELTNYCNLHCPECLSGSGQMKREQGYMNIDLFNKVVEELRPYLFNLNLYFQGEPMLHPGFFSFIHNCNGINSTVSTNGHFLSLENSERIVRSGLKKLIISLDGIDQETYSVYRVGGDLETVIQGIKNVSDAKRRFKSKLLIEIQCLVNSINEKQIPQLRKLARKEKVSLRLKSMQIINKSNIGSWLPDKSKFRRYKSRDGEYITKNSLPNRCARLWFNPVITWEGKVLPCCFDKDADHIMGDLNHDSFKDIWDGPKYRIFRKSILAGRSMIDICSNCTSGLRGVNY